MAEQQSNIVVDRGKWEWSEMWSIEDWWAIWLGFILLIVGLIIFLPRPPANMHERLATAEATMAAEDARAPFKTIEWHGANDAKTGLRARNEPHGRTIAKWQAGPGLWSTNPIDAFYLSESQAAERRAKAKPAFEKAQEATRAGLERAREVQALAAEEGFRNEILNEDAMYSIAEWRDARDKERGRLRAEATIQPFNKAPYMLGLMIIIGLFFSFGSLFMKNMDTVGLLKGFSFVFLLAVVALLVGKQSTMHEFGFVGLIWAILLGMLISNTVGVPNFIKPALQTEYFIKTGLVLLGAEILFSKILLVGQAGIVVAWVVTPIVLILTYIFGQRVLKMESKTLNIVVSADMSVCGVSAAIATASACRATKEELTIAVGISLPFTAIMMVAMPTFILAVGMHPVLGGAWIGGTIDSTGAVVAAGAFLGDVGLFVAATVKMIQNILIGVIAFGVAVYWCARVDCVPGQRVSKMEIWYRFPKFVLGFILASIIFSWILTRMGSAGDVMIDQGVLRGFTRPLREWFFVLAFASIGLASNFRVLAHHFKGGKPVTLYVCGQSFNLAFTLLVAWLMYFVVFPHVTEELMGMM